MIAIDHQRRYSLRSKKIDDTFSPVARPKKNKVAVKISAEKSGRSEILIASDFPSLEVKIAHKPHSTLNFEN